eukprot:Phypoly_transcript_04164.p1 GENE.Phypoly_transcript_04164~~Phypoly_transcript_04164.p1  ORF type:complete len:645 (+),score=123.60 Phypoly_transcript_04164:77-2011(+)
MKGKGEEHYNDTAANYFILFVLAIVTLPSTFVFLKNRLAPARDTSARCACSSCKQKEASTKAKTSKRPSVGTIFKAIALVVLWVCFVQIFLNSTTTTEQQPAGYFDPYAILGLEPGESLDVIKRVYKKLSLQYHPDKADDPTDPAVQTRYINLVKAYETLTDDAIREKWEKYGNPDGPQAMSVGIALPSWLIRKDNTFIVLGVYMALLVIGLPVVVGCWWRSWKKYDTSSKVMNSSMGLYYHTLDPTARLKTLVELVAASEEFSKIPMRESDANLEKAAKRLPDSHSFKKKPKFTAPYAIKTHLLLYVQICRDQYELKTGHKLDLTFILSKIRPLIGGMITICTARAFFTPIVESLHLLQSLTQSCWKETPLLQLPHFTEYSASNASGRRYQANDVISFASLPADKKKEFYEKEEFKPEQIKDIEDVLAFLPTKVACEYSIAVEGEDPDTIVCGAIVTFFFSITRNPTDPSKANTMVSVKQAIEPDTPSSIKKKNLYDAARPKRIVHAPHFWGDQREECWWLVIGDLRASGTTGGLAGIHKIGTLEGEKPVEGKIKFMAPATEGNYTFVAYLVCDGYHGFDKKVEFRLRVVRDEVAERERTAQAERMRLRQAKLALEGKGAESEDDDDDDDSVDDSDEDGDESN